MSINMDRVKYFIILLLLCLFIPINGLAKEEITLKTNKSDLEIGDEVKLTASLKTDQKLYALTATLSYDNNVFSEIDRSNFSVSDDNISVIYTPGSQKFGLINASGEFSNELFSVTLKVKSNAHVGNTLISLTNIKASDGNSEFNFNKTTTKLLVTKDAKDGEVIVKNESKKVKEKDEKSIKTFSTIPLIIGITLASLLVIFCMFYTSYENRKKLGIGFISLLGVFFLILIILLICNTSKKDVNKDGKKDYDDSKKIIEYLIDMQGVNDNKLSQDNPTNLSNTYRKKYIYDINNDGYIDIKDAASSVYQTTQNINYKVSLSKVKEDSIYIEKGNVTLNFKAEVNPNEVIKEVQINGKYYPVTFHSTYYSVNLGKKMVAGVYEFNITKVKLNNNREINAKLSLTREVLKDKPYVDMFNVDDEDNTFNFRLEDKDHAFNSGKVIVTDEDGNEVINEEVKTENHFEYEFDQDKTYHIKVLASYDLDSNKLNYTTGQQNLYEDVEIYKHDLMVFKNYDFKIENVVITDAIEKNDKLIINFDSSNAIDSPVYYIVINNKEYDIEKLDDNSYKVVIDKIDTSKFGKYSLNIEKVVIGTLKSFENGKDYHLNELTYNVLKNFPTVDNISLHENKEDESIIASYNFSDPDYTLEKLTAVLVDSTDKILDIQKGIVPGEDIVLSHKGNQDGKYKVKFLADCNLGTDRHYYTDKLIGEKEILTQQDIYIKNVTVSTVYPVKNQKKYEVTYELEVSESFKNSHRYNKVSSITINGLNYDANQKTGFTSTVSFTIPDKAGIIDLEATRVQLQYEDYNNNTRAFFSVKPNITQIEVLKDKPTIENFNIVEEDYTAKKVTFSFDVVDDQGGFTKGEVELNGQTQAIVRGNNKVTFENVEQDKVYDINFFGDYDLDTNMLKGQDPNENRYTHDLIYTKSYGLYNSELYNKIKLNDIKAVGNSNSEFVKKFEDVKLGFNVEDLDPTLNLDIDKVVIKDQEYQVTHEDDTYYVTIPGYNTSGVKDIEIKDIILNNGKKITLTDSVKTKIEVLKDPVKIEDFKYVVNNNDITMSFNLKDFDHSIVDEVSESLQVKVYDEDNNLIETLPYSDTLTIKRKENIDRYYIQVLANYDLDISKTNDKNNYANQKLLDEVISVDKNYLEIKDITDVKLYKADDDNTTIVENVDIDALKSNLDNYFVEISMKNMPTVRSKIKKVVDEDNRMIFILDFNFATNDMKKESKDLRLDFGEIKNGVAHNELHPETFEELVERIKANPDSKITLTNDLDASSYNSSSTTMIDKVFTGTFDGNSHVIKNLNKPLFNELNGATVENIKFEEVRLPGANAQGTLANTATNSIIKNILINNFKKDSSTGTSGTLIGKISNHTIVEECKTTDFVINSAWAQQQIGGLIGTVDNSTVRNSYVVGQINASWNYVSGFIGSSNGASILENNYSKVTLSNSAATVSCGFTCGSANLVAKNNVSLNKLSARVNHRFISGMKESANNYYLLNGQEEFKQDGVTNITESQVNKNLFQDISFDSDIWNLKNISYDNTPSFNIEHPSVINIDQVGNKYDEDKENLYRNLLLLMPFYDSEKIVDSAKNIPKDNLLYSEEIMHIVPVDETGNIVTYLTSDNPKKIQKIKIIFKNNKRLEYSVRYYNTYDMVASYRINELKIDYTFNHYIIDSTSEVVNHLTNYLSNLTYNDNLDPLTKSDDSRLYRDHYNEVTKNELREFVLKYLSNSDYANTTNNEVIDHYLEKEVKKGQILEKTLYVYNYFSRFYSVDIDGVMLNDLILFDLDGFGPKMSLDEIVTRFLSDEKNLELNATNATYERIFTKYTNLKSIPEFLEYLVNGLSDMKVDRWYASQFKGYLREVKVDNRDDIRYTLWDHMKYADAYYNATWYNYILPIITLPKNAAYILSTPTQFIIGAQRTYTTNPDSLEEQEKLQHRIETYATRMKDYYTTAASILGDAKYFNDINTIQIDKRYTLDSNGNTVFQNPYTTQEPFHKNFNEVLGQWAYNDYNAATANGLHIIWRVEGLLDGNLEAGSEYTFETWAHETAHNMDARLFLKNNGRRFDAGGEDYADGNLTQTFGDGDIVMNLSRHFQGVNTNISANLEPSRIDTPQKIHDFYNKLFQTVYIMDYLEGRAFLELDNEEKSKIAVEAFYPNEEQYSDDKLDYMNKRETVYHSIEKEDFDKMKLETVDDLYDNHLVIFPGVIYSTYGTNRYGGENIYKVRWYQPHNDKGRPDSYSIKWFAYEMLGYKGYDDGYIKYYSNINPTSKEFYKENDPNKPVETRSDYKTDLIAIRSITNDDTMTFERYKKMRFKEVEDNLQNIQVIKVNEIFNEFYLALKKDALYVKEVEQAAWEKYPNSDDNSVRERNNMISKARQGENSKAVRRKVYYAIKNATNDFLGDVYNSKNPQVVSEFTIPE